MNTRETTIESLRVLRNELARAGDGDTEDFTDAVMGQVAVSPAPRLVRRRRRWRRFVALTVTVALAIAPGPRGAVARWLGIGAVRIERDSTRQVAGVPDAILGLDLGTLTSVSEASAQLGHPLAVMTKRRPDQVWTDKLVGAGSMIVSSVYVNGDSAFLVSEFPGPGSIVMNKKLLGQGSQVEFFDLNGRSAMWISGSPHEVLVQSANGNVTSVPIRIAGNVLLWADETRTLRIEGIDDRGAAVAVLMSLLE